MRTKEELREGCAALLKKLRIDKKLSKSKMAELLYIDDHTWDRYEKGQSAPSVPDFIYLFDALDEDALRTVLDYIYPDIYHGLSGASEMSQIREAAAHYFKDLATDRAAREWCFIAFGHHGSNLEPQLDMITMINHLPLAYRVVVAQTVANLYELAQARGELVLTDGVMPDLDVFYDGLSKAKEASFKRQTAYTTGVK